MCHIKRIKRTSGKIIEIEQTIRVDNKRKNALKLITFEDIFFLKFHLALSWRHYQENSKEKALNSTFEK